VSEPLTPPEALSDHLATYRRTREQLERHILPLATSVDGASFTIQASLHGLELARGGYVVLEGDGAPRLGQVTDLAVATMPASSAGVGGLGFDTILRLAAGSGRVLDSDGRPFHDSRARPAAPTEVGAWLERTRPRRAGLAVGQLVHAPGVPAVLDSGGLGRHSFLVGQSGSGKTYSLGLLLERVLADTSLRIVILDPNSDHVRLGDVRDDADPGPGRVRRPHRPPARPARRRSPDRGRRAVPAGGDARGSATRHARQEPGSARLGHLEPDRTLSHR